MGERASCRIDIAALKLLFCQISYASRVFFTLTMHPGLLPNFALSRSHLILGPSVHRLSPQEPHFLDKPHFDHVSLLEISLRIHYSKRYRCESIAKTRVRLKNCQKRFIAEFRRRHCPTSIDSRISSIRGITLNRTRIHQCPVLAMDFQGSCGGRGVPFCNNSIDWRSGERTKAMLPSRGGRLIVTPAFMSSSQVA